MTTPKENPLRLYHKEESGELWLGDCLELMRTMPDKCIDLVLTDPPYPDYYVEEYKYNPEPIKFLDKFKCRQLIFWTAKMDFLMDYTAIHIWDKKVGAGSWYERIFERNGGIEFKVYRDYLINSTVAASFTRDTFTGHPSQKPLNLIKKLIVEYTKEGDLVFDPFLGSGTTSRACKDLNRKFIGCEISEKYCEIAKKRLEQEVLF